MARAFTIPRPLIYCRTVIGSASRLAKHPKARLGLFGVMTIAIVAATTVGLRSLIRTEATTGWGEAIQAVSTIVLVAVTAFYAFWTFKLVKLQETTPEKAIRRETQERAVEALLEHTQTPEALSLLGDRAPFEPAEGLDFGDLIDECTKKADAIFGIAPRLPGDLSDEASACALRIITATNLLLSLETQCLKEGVEAFRQARPWDPSRVRQQLEPLVNVLASDWDAFVNGSTLQHAIGNLQRLDSSARRYFR